MRRAPSDRPSTPSFDRNTGFQLVIHGLTYGHGDPGTACPAKAQGVHAEVEFEGIGSVETGFHRLQLSTNQKLETTHLAERSMSPDCRTRSLIGPEQPNPLLQSPCVDDLTL
jgi:hypothetical protein